MIVKAEVFVGVTGLDEKEAEVPEGKPAVIERVTAELKPFNEARVTVETPEAPVCGALTALGDKEREKSGTPGALTVIVAVPEAIPSLCQTTTLAV